MGNNSRINRIDTTKGFTASINSPKDAVVFSVYSMELLNDTPVLQIARNKSWIYEMSRIESVQDTGPMNVNVTKNKNDSQLKAIFDFYHLYDRIK